MWRVSTLSSTPIIRCRPGLQPFAETYFAFPIYFSVRIPMTHTTRLFASLFVSVALASAIGCASTSTQEGTGEYIDDTVITTKVKSAIFNESTLKSAEINVETFKGVVQLSGFVSSAADERKAGEIAAQVKGVKSVKNDTRVKQ